jgi:2-dehydropantoate 2-reductase
MNILLVGAGAVGQAYGWHLQGGGASVSFLVHEKYAAACRAGLTLYPLNRPKATRWQPVPFTGFGVLTHTDTVAAATWDQVWLCISSPALRGPWLDALLDAIGSATLVFLQPGLRDREAILERWPAERLVQGRITLLSYQAPLPGEHVPHPGVAYFFPPLSATPFTGPPARTQAVVDALRAGGCRAKVSPHVRQQVALGSAVLMPHVVALETAGWSVQALRTGPLLPLAARASHEAMRIAATYIGCPLPAARHVVHPLLTRLALGLAPRLLPFDLQTYLRYHFTKVGAQTRAAMAVYIALGTELGLSSTYLEQLLREPEVGV